MTSTVARRQSRGRWHGRPPVDLGTGHLPAGSQAIVIDAEVLAIPAGRYRMQAEWKTSTGRARRGRDDDRRVRLRLCKGGRSRRTALLARALPRCDPRTATAAGGVDVAGWGSRARRSTRSSMVGDEMLAHKSWSTRRSPARARPRGGARLSEHRRLRFWPTSARRGSWSSCSTTRATARAAVPVAFNAGLLREPGRRRRCTSRVGQAWSYAVPRDGAREAGRLRRRSACSRARAAAPFDGTESVDAGRDRRRRAAHVDLVIACGAWARQTFTIAGHAERRPRRPPRSARASAPERRSRGGAPIAITPSFASVDPITVTLVQSPASASFADGVARWTPDSESAIGGAGEVVFTFQRDDRRRRRRRGGLGGALRRSRRRRSVGRVRDSPSGLSPDVADADGDPDGDGLDHSDEDVLGTLGDVADSDGDGLDDGAEVHDLGAPRSDSTPTATGSPTATR